MDSKGAVHSRFFSNVGMLSLLNLISAFLPLLLLPFYLKTLGASVYGQILLSQVFCLYLVMLCDFGFNLFLPREIASKKADRNYISKIISSVFFAKTGLLLISLVIVIFASQVSGRLSETPNLLFLAFIYVVANALNPMSVFQGFEVLHIYSITILSAKLLSAGCILAFITGPEHAELVLLIQGFFLLLASVFLFFLMIRRFKLKLSLVSALDAYRVCKDASVYFISRISNEGLSNTISFLVGLKLGPENLSIFYTAERFYRAGLLMLTPITQSLYPYMTRVKDVKFFSALLGFVCFVVTVGIAISFIFVDQSLLLLFGSLAPYISELYVVFMMALWLGAIGSLLGFPFLGALGYVREANVSIIFGAAIGLSALLYVFIYYDHVVYFVIPFVIFEAFTLSSRAYFIWKNRVGVTGK